MQHNVPSGSAAYISWDETAVLLLNITYIFLIFVCEQGIAAENIEIRRKHSHTHTHSVIHTPVNRAKEQKGKGTNEIERRKKEREDGL